MAPNDEGRYECPYCQKNYASSVGKCQHLKRCKPIYEAARLREAQANTPPCIWLVTNKEDKKMRAYMREDDTRDFGEGYEVVMVNVVGGGVGS